MTDPTTLSAGDGFTVPALYVYDRGPGDPPGNSTVYLCSECQRTRALGHAKDCPNIPKQQPVAVPTTLSAAELDAIEQDAKLSCNEHVNGQCYTRACFLRGGWKSGPTEGYTPTCMAKNTIAACDAARRIVAAERKLAAVDAVLTAFPAEWTVFKRDIRRALAEG